MEEIDLIDMIFFLLKRIWIIIIIAIICALVGGIYTKVTTELLYESSTSIILTKQNFSNIAEVEVYKEAVDRYCVVAGSRKIAENVIQNLKLEISLSEVQKAIEIKSMPENQCMRVHVTFKDPEIAAKISDETARVLIDEIKRIYNDDGLQILDKALIDSNPINDNLMKNIVKFACLGCVMGMACIFILYFYKINYKEKENKEK